MNILDRQFSIFNNFICVTISLCFFLFTEKIYLNIIYWIKYRKILDLSNPKTFQEKMQWLKLYDRGPNYITLLDKYLVKQYVAKLIGHDYIIPTIGVWDNVNDITFSELPEKFVIKCTHGSDSCRICLNKDQLNTNEYKKYYSKALKRNYYNKSKEWPYKNVKSRIIVEQYINDLRNPNLIDYKFFCFRGKPLFCQVIKNRCNSMTIDFFNMKWESLPFSGLLPSLNKLIPSSSFSIEKPICFDEMVAIAKKISSKLRFCRVDLYYTNSRVYFGEITLFPNSGFGTFFPEEYNSIVGNNINI